MATHQQRGGTPPRLGTGQSLAGGLRLSMDSGTNDGQLTESSINDGLASLSAFTNCHKVVGFSPWNGSAPAWPQHQIPLSFALLPLVKPSLFHTMMTMGCTALPCCRSGYPDLVSIPFMLQHRSELHPLLPSFCSCYITEQGSTLCRHGPASPAVPPFLALPVVALADHALLVLLMKHFGDAIGSTHAALRNQCSV